MKSVKCSKKCLTAEENKPIFCYRGNCFVSKRETGEVIFIKEYLKKTCDISKSEISSSLSFELYQTITVWCKEVDAISDHINLFLDKFETFLHKIRMYINNAESELKLFADELKFIINALDEFKQDREAFQIFLKQIKPLFIDKIKEGDSHYLWNPPPVCKICSRMPNCAVDASVNGYTFCHRGYTIFQNKFANICGIKVKTFFSPNCSKNFKDHTVPVMSMKFFEFLLEKHIFLKSQKNELGKFLHDLGQYTPGLRNQLPFNIRDFNIISARDKKSILAFCDALECMHYNLKNKLNGCFFSNKVTFSPFQLFDKYRICFESNAFNINLGSSTHNKFYFKICCLKGFDIVVLNLLANACKYLPDDDIYNNINIDLQRQSSLGMQIIIESYGYSLSSLELKRLGIKGYRGDLALKSGKNGSGIGLNQVVEYIERAGLDIEFESDLSKEKVINSELYSPFIIKISIPEEMVEK